MTPSEFKAWFSGFTEGLEGTPTEKQWERICKRVEEIDGTPSTPIYIERYRDRWWPGYCINGPQILLNDGAPIRLSTITVSNGSSSVVAGLESTAAKYEWSPPLGAHSVMFSVGKDDAAELVG